MVSCQRLVRRAALQAYKVGWRCAPRLLAPRANGPRVLLYHSVDDAPNCYTSRLGHNVLPAHFEDHVRFLSERYHVVRLDELPRHAGDPGAVALTFDDGCKSVLTRALPVLEKYHCPAKLFVTTCHIDRSINWLNQLSYLLNVLSRQQAARLAEVALAEGRATGGRPGVHDFVRAFDPSRTPQAIAGAFAGVHSGRLPELYLTSRDLDYLAGHALVDVGSHTENHYPLDRLNAEQIREEIVTNHWELHKRLGGRVKGFAVPFGFREHLTEAVVSAVREVDDCIVSAYGGRLDGACQRGLPELRRTPAAGNLGALWYCLGR